MKLLSEEIFLLFFILNLCLACDSQTSEIKQNSHWETYRGTPDAGQFSSLDQIDTNNVHQLQLAWKYSSADAGNSSTIECNPIIIDQVMYVTSPQLKVIALNAVTGSELWQFDPFDGERGAGVNRGVTYWQDGEDKRILFVATNFLYCLDAENGRLVSSFGKNGQVDLRYQLGGNPEKFSLTTSTPGIIYQNLIILGSATGEGYNASPGHIRAYDIKTGDLVWIFHTIPQPGEYGYHSWTFYETENYGGTNNWGGMSLDQEKGIVYIATGSPTYDFYGGTRPGDNLFGNCVIALNAETGERIWHYQVVHHDLWDYDLACAPNLTTILHKGQYRDVVVQPTKMGTLFILDRYTGELLSDAPEKLMPPSDLDGEVAASSQPMVQDLVFVRQGIYRDDLTDISPESNAYAQKRFDQLKHGQMFTPPSEEGTILFPGTRGGVLWGGASLNPHTNILYLNANEYPMIMEMKKVTFDVSEAEFGHESEETVSGPSINKLGKEIYLLNCASCHGREKEGIEGSYPGIDSLDQKYSRQEVADIIRKGADRMPPYTQFDQEEMQSLLNYIMDIEVESPQLARKKEMDKYVLQGYQKFLDQDGYPAVKPPWGTLNAIDLNNFEILWQVPLGEYPGLVERGIRNTGTQTFGGCVATAGGVIFVGATADEKFRALNASNGEVLWEYQLPYGGYATPAVYQVDGKQYVVIAAGGGNRNGTPSGDFYLAFSLAP
ncbi:MAG: pyrroloquinoline quinone-dependent dehydrogenase [Candidatus Cyclobacteriaceae bacterium M3_2C_046]